MATLDFELHEHYGDGAWYDAEYVHIGGDLPYYTDVARQTAQDANILELACGTGRLTIPMVKAIKGRVHGVDLAPSMIEQANKKREALPEAIRSRLSFEVADIRTFRTDLKFDAVILAFNTLMHMLSDEDLLAALRCARSHLSSRGLFYFDIHTPFPQLLERDPSERYDPQQMIEPGTGHRYLVTDNNDYDARTQINTMRFFYQRIDQQGQKVGKEKRAEIKLRVLFPRELDLLLRMSGFKVLGDWDDFQRSKPFSGKGGRRVVVAQAASFFDRSAGRD